MGGANINNSVMDGNTANSAIRRWQAHKRLLSHSLTLSLVLSPVCAALDGRRSEKAAANKKMVCERMKKPHSAAI